MVVRVGGQDRHVIPIQRALEFMAQALAENGNDVGAAEAALKRAFDQLKRI